LSACSSAEQALEAGFENSADVVLMDINLPGQSGIECVAKLKHRRRELQVIAFCAGSALDFRMLMALRVFSAEVWLSSAAIAVAVTATRATQQARRASLQEPFNAPHGFFLSPRGTSGERIEERGIPDKNAPPLPSPLLHPMKEREKGWSPNVR